MAYTGALEDLARERMGTVPVSLLGLENATLSPQAKFIEELRRRDVQGGSYHLQHFIDDCFNGNITPRTVQPAFDLLCRTEKVDKESMRDEVANALRDADRDLSLLDKEAMREIGLNIIPAGA